MLKSLEEETEGKFQMLLSPKKSGLDSLLRRLGFSRLLGSQSEAQGTQNCLQCLDNVDVALTVSRLRGPVAILFISRDTCSNSIAKPFSACFYGVSHNYRAIYCKMGYRTDAPVRN